MIKKTLPLPPSYNYYRKRILLYIFFAFLSSLSIKLSADGGKPGEMFLWGTGARYLAMGGSGTAPNRIDAFSPYYNSGALGFIEQKEIATLHSILWEETSYSYLAYVHPIYSGGGTLGIEIARLYSGGALKTDENNLVIGEFYNQQISMGVGYGKTINEKLSLGLKIKFFNNFLDQISASNFIVDGGAIYKPFDSLSLGIAMQNFIAMNLNDTSEDIMPFIIKFGSGYNIFGERLSIAFDFYTGSGISSQEAYSIGIESRLNNNFALRLGKSRQDEITGGLGISIGGFSLDYAMGMHYLGLSHRASLNFRFGKSRKEMEELAKKAEAAAKVIETSEAPSQTAPEDEQRLIAFQENYQGAINMYKRGLFTIALDRFKNAASLDPTDPDVPLYIERLNLITPIVPQNMAQDKVSELMRRGIVYFVEGHGQSSVKTLAYALSLEPDNFTLMRLLGRVEEKTGYRVDRSQPASGLTLVDKMQYESLIAFKKKDYAETIKLCEDILLLEPDNALALKRMGSAFYALGEKEKAKKMWQRSLEISYDKKLDELIKKIK